MPDSLLNCHLRFAQGDPFLSFVAAMECECIEFDVGKNDQDFFWLRGRS